MNSPCRGDLRTFFICDLKNLTEDADPKEAIVYYHPSLSPLDTEAIQLCGHIMAVAQFTSKMSVSSSVSLIRQKHTKCAVQTSGSCIMVLSCGIYTADHIMEYQLSKINHLLTFYHGALHTLVHSFTNVTDFQRYMTPIMTLMLRFVQQHNIISSALPSLNYINYQQDHVAKLTAHSLIQTCKDQYSAIGGCIFYKQSILASVLPSELLHLITFILNKDTYNTPYYSMLAATATDAPDVDSDGDVVTGNTIEDSCHKLIVHLWPEQHEQVLNATAHRSDTLSQNDSEPLPSDARRTSSYTSARNSFVSVISDDDGSDDVYSSVGNDSVYDDDDDSNDERKHSCDVTLDNNSDGDVNGDKCDATPGCDISIANKQCDTPVVVPESVECQYSVDGDAENDDICDVSLLHSDDNISVCSDKNQDKCDVSDKHDDGKHITNDCDNRGSDVVLCENDSPCVEGDSDVLSVDQPAITHSDTGDNAVDEDRTTGASVTDPSVCNTLTLDRTEHDSSSHDTASDASGREKCDACSQHSEADKSHVDCCAVGASHTKDCNLNLETTEKHEAQVKESIYENHHCDGMNEVEANNASISKEKQAILPEANDCKTITADDNKCRVNKSNTVCNKTTSNIISTSETETVDIVPSTCVDDALNDNNCKGGDRCGIDIMHNNHDVTCDKSSDNVARHDVDVIEQDCDDAGSLSQLSNTMGPSHQVHGGVATDNTRITKDVQSQSRHVSGCENNDVKQDVIDSRAKKKMDLFMSLKASLTEDMMRSNVEYSKRDSDLVPVHRRHRKSSGHTAITAGGGLRQKSNSRRSSHKHLNTATDSCTSEETKAFWKGVDTRNNDGETIVYQTNSKDTCTGASTSNSITKSSGAARSSGVTISKSTTASDHIAADGRASHVSDDQDGVEMVKLCMYVQRCRGFTCMCLLPIVPKYRATCYKHTPMFQTIDEGLSELLYLMNNDPPPKSHAKYQGYHFLSYNNSTLAMKGTLMSPLAMEEHDFCEAAVSLHYDYASMQICDTTLRGPHGVLLAHRNSSQELYLTQSDAKSRESTNLGFPSEKDTDLMVVPSQ